MRGKIRVLGSMWRSREIKGPEQRAEPGGKRIRRKARHAKLRVGLIVRAGGRNTPLRKKESSPAPAADPREGKGSRGDPPMPEF